MNLTQDQLIVLAKDNGARIANDVRGIPARITFDALADFNKFAELLTNTATQTIDAKAAQISYDAGFEAGKAVLLTNSDAEPVAYRYDEKGWDKDTYSSTYSEAPPEQNPTLAAKCINIVPLCLCASHSKAEQDAEIVEAAKNLVKVKGRHNSELAMNRLIQAITKG